MDLRLHTREEYFATMPSKGLFNFVIGDCIADGLHRIVFEYALDPRCVVKYQYADGFQNVVEWNLWNDMEFSDNRNWLAPCVAISECGQWLIQKKTKPLPSNYKLPDRLPRFMTDIKPENFGLYRGKLVCHDYANNLCCNYAMDKATKKADWFS